ncbi:uncharacterized protein PV09_01483 [Verruconis gallopava]|uniref:DUF2231 domain-containing protein n=1 Tax=Verruconis gallopava TaxID=253628 RepID=A0A0D2AM46_9PEZI|nr:uncharacterized protein PV09_01483 [Verruconis gallopava]KIW07520.1 hypothetical protein PV09_01483 [Verruconis gallopava]
MGHPAHPVFVHHPIAFLSMSYALDIIYGVATHPFTAKAVASVYDVTPYLGDVAKFSHYFNMLGLVFAVPAVLSGGQQLMSMIKKQDLASKFEKSQNKAATAQKMHPKMKAAFAHAAMMDVCIATAVYNWWTRSTRAGYVPGEMSLFVSAGTLAAIILAGYIGAELVYEYGVAVASPSRRSKED